jgi:hypothetical protein
MSNVVLTSFYYDPVRQGYDTNSWMTISGAPTAIAGRLVMDTTVGIAGAAVHYADFLKGDISFNLNIPTTPVSGDTRFIGVASPTSVSYVRFAIGPTLTCQVSNGISTVVSAALPWDSTGWNGVDIDFRIRWEAGTAKFFIDDTQVYAITSDAVPAGPMSLYLLDNSTTAMTIGDIYVRGTQSFVMNPKSSGTSTSPVGTLSVIQAVTVTDVVAGMMMKNYVIPGVGQTMFQPVTVSENVNLFVTKLYETLNDTVTVSEDTTDITLTIIDP